MQSPNPLDRYLKARGLTREQFARQLDVSAGLISHWITGRVQLPAERAAAIERVTGGALTRQQLRPDLFA